MRQAVRSGRRAVLAAVLVMLATSDRSQRIYALGQADPGHSIEAEVKGTLKPGFQISATGLTWDVDISGDGTLRQAAEQLAGKQVIVRGKYAERNDGPRVRRILTARALEPAAETGRREYVDVTVRGTLRVGVVAIGGETTGATITAGPVTWELELDGGQRELAVRLNGSTALVSGPIRPVGGVEVRTRTILTVRRIQ